MGGFVIKTDGLPKTAADHTTQIVEAAKEALAVTENYRNMFGSGEGTCSLFATVRAAAQSVRLPQDTELILELPDSELTMLLPTEQVRKLFKELVNNSGKALAQGDHKRQIHVIGTVTADSVSIVVQDTGCGVSDEDLGTIWGTRYRARGDAPGMGFGLWWAKTLWT